MCTLHLKPGFIPFFQLLVEDEIDFYFTSVYLWHLIDTPRLEIAHKLCLYCAAPERELIGVEVVIITHAAVPTLFDI